ncbi:DUF58 domain-containing protein [Bacteroidetes/Chlorobi group bacterium Naka2016]|jgi:uncharacterized protein (DUF58 family)|nr:MAG: DUF58 domain-containing protein [Bacteroidetes/Chlorobi group bacterium Naka2016]
METTELLRKVRKIEIKTRKLSQNIFSGQYHSVFKGQGIAFSEVREYQIGDDVRLIDWNVTARFNHPFVKVFEEERELTLVLLIDVSGSESFGTRETFKRNLIAEVSAVLSFSALQNNDKIGAILFSNDVERFIPPKKGRTHVLHIVRELLNYEPSVKTTNISRALQFVFNSIKKKAIVFIISDFLDSGFEDPLKIVARKHDTIAIQVVDQREGELLPVGLIYLQDAETGESIWFDTNDPNALKNYKIWWNSRQLKLKEMFQKYKVDHIQIKTGESYIEPLIEFFRRRGKRT